MFTPFHNEPYVNFNEEKPRKKMQDALDLVTSSLGRSYSVVIGGERIETPNAIVSRNPARWTQIIGNVGEATPEMADLAVEAAQKAFPAWSKTSVEARARTLVKAAAMMRRRLYEFSTWMVLEASKSWPEAYADAAEAVDFLEFYAREALRWGGSHPTTPYAGEENEVRYYPVGIGVIISPWNFPLAILVGMTAAAIVTGNTVVIKPAEQTSVIAAKFFQLLEDVCLPPGVVNFLPGPGETVGEALTGHPGIHFVSFTGSRDVGVHINERVAKVQPGQRWLKRAILEMGGKDAIIVDEGVSIDGAAEGVVSSAFGFQGQKCSACSRLIAHTKIYDELLEKIVARTARINVGDPTVHTNYMGAVIDGEAFRKIMTYIAVGRTEGRVMIGGEESEADNDGGFFIHPTIIADVDPSARIAQEEIFGPLLTVIRANDFEHALEIANGTDYGLTGGVFSYNRDNLERARHEFEVGNLYLNRKCTGALVDVQPFGGFKMSGTNSKAGGRHYLAHFLQAKSISERW